LFRLKGRRDASSSVPSILRVAASLACAAGRLADGPLTVDRAEVFAESVGWGLRFFVAMLLLPAGWKCAAISNQWQMRR
jgi:hypothetical protein